MPHFDSFDGVSNQRGEDLLDVVDMVLQLDRQLAIEVCVIGYEPDDAAIMIHNEFVVPDWLVPMQTWPLTSSRARLVDRLEELLVDAGSVYSVSWTLPICLVRRVDPTVHEAVELAISVAPPTAAQMLRSAWRATYGRHPDPNTAYREAVRAVEEVACPLIVPNGTLGTATAHLRDAGHKWTFVLVDRVGNGTVAPLAAMMERLWQGQQSRHGGGDQNRDQTQAEAEAAVQLATTLVHLLSTNTLTRR